MGVMEEALWDVLVRKAGEEDERLRPDQRVANEYLSGVRSVCVFGVDRARTIRDYFPMYTLHDETHICSVLRRMADLLGDSVDRLSRDEAAMLILAACCHDIGMSCSEQERDGLLGDRDRLAQYLERNHSEYVKAYAANPDEPELTDGMLQKYLRSIHHERASELLGGIEWPAVLWGRVDRDDLVRVCQSHGEFAVDLNGMAGIQTVDLRFCAILLRLADILDFDTSRAPRAVYDYSGLERAEGDDAKVSREEWQKHMASQGFDFLHVTDRQMPYDLPYHAVSRSMQIEQTVNSYLDWADHELDECGKLLRRYTGKWQDFILPSKIKRVIKAEGYVSGQYRLTMDQDQIMELLVGEELYSDPSVFVRELIQNAIDAVRTREQLDKNLPRDWRPRINIRSWMDEEGYHWFRIEDNGTGMTKDIIENYFLKIGSSYYASDTFRKEKIRCRADPDYTPISRFGIGILSCFMGGEDSNRVEVSTKRFGADGERPPALRLSMHGMSGYYYMASQGEGHRPRPMSGVTASEKRPYLPEPGTVVAVRTNLYQTGKYTGFKEIVDRYVVYPSVPIHYDGVEGSFDYATKDEFMEAVHSIHPSDDPAEQGVLEIPMTEEQCRQVSRDIPGLVFDVPPKVVLKCAPLDRYTESPYLSGAVLTAKVVGRHAPMNLKIGKRSVKADVNIGLSVNDARDALSIRVSLNFPREFRRTIQIIEEKYQHDDVYPGIDEKAMRMYRGDSEQERIQREIIAAIIRRYDDNPDWKRYMRRKWPDLSVPELNQKIREAEQKYQEVTGRVLPNRDERQMLKVYSRYSRDYEILICKLRDYVWYKKHFRNVYDRVLLRNAAAHNGILCGDSEFFFSDDWNKKKLGSIVLLQDKYRPGVDVARLGIRELSLEMSCDLTLIGMSLEREGFPNGINQKALLKDKPWMISASIYSSLLKKRPDLEKRLVFDTDRGSCGCDGLKNLVKKHHRILLKEGLAFAGGRENEQRRMCYQLCLAYLKQNYALYMTLTGRSREIYITEKRGNTGEEISSIFPSALFLRPEGKCEYLTERTVSFRYFCNMDHRLSQFIIKNGDLLHQKVPGILKELIRVLQEEENGKLIRAVNDLLTRLRSLPGQPITVPDDVFLTAEDLC